MSDSCKIAGGKRRSSSLRKRPFLDRRELLIALTLALTICVPPWLLGGMRWWQQLIFFALSLVPFILCFLPGGKSTVKEQLIRLLKFPVFWAGLLFLLYVAVGALNYSWAYVISEDGKRLHLEQLPQAEFFSWLPNGVKAPFTSMSPWRIIINYGAGLFIVCAAWLGLTRRRAVFLVVSLIGANAFLIALLTILQKLSGTDLIYWYFEPANKHFAGPFHYRNHGVTWLYMGLAATISSAFYHWRRMREEGLTSGPAPLFAFFGFVIAVSIAMAGSRGGILFGGLVMAMACLAFVFTVFRTGKSGLIALGLIAVCGLVGLYFTRPILDKTLPQLKMRWNQTQKQMMTLKEDRTDQDQRIILTKVTLEMWEERPWYGWGAGSYRYIFPIFQQNYPTLFYHWWTMGGDSPPKRLHFFYAHNDWAQSLAEYGIIGTALLTLCLSFWFFWLPTRYLFSITTESFMLYSGAGATFFHSLIDFPMWNPAVLLLFILMLGLGGKLLVISGER